MNGEDRGWKWVMMRGPDFQGLLLPEKGEESLPEFLSTLYMTGHAWQQRYFILQI